MIEKYKLQLSETFGMPKLSFCFIPRLCVGSNLRSLLTTKDWDKIRREEYRKARHTCTICDNTSGLPLHCHEEWKFHDDQQIQELVELQVLCEHCHAAKHLVGTYVNKSLTYFAGVVNHIQNVNDWTRDELVTYTKLCTVINSIRSRQLWSMHVSLIYDRDVTINWKTEPTWRQPKSRVLKVKV